MKKKIIATLVIVLLVTGCGKVPKLASGEEAIVSFDNAELNISANDLYNELKDKYALNVLIDMIDNTILKAKYPKAEEDAKKYAKDQLDQIKENYVDDKGKYNEDALISALRQAYGFNTVADFEEVLVLSYYRDKAIEDYAKKQVKDKDVESYYKTDIHGDISAKHILIAVDAKDNMTEEEIAKLEKAALKKAENLIKELDNGADFSKLAKEHSADKGSAEKGGDLGEFSKGKMVPEFEKAAFELKLNKYTAKPVKSKHGYHIILKTAEKEKPKLETVKNTIVETLSKKLLKDDSAMSLNAIIELRKSYGFKIQDSDVNKRYSTYTSNQLLQLKNPEQQ